MKYYFELQKLRAERIIREFGLPPWIAILLAIVLMSIICFILYVKTSYASFILGFFGLSFCFSMGEKYRNEFLLKTYHKQDYRWIRIIENCMIILPFIIAMLIIGGYLEVLIVFASAVILTFLKFRGLQGKARQTLFSQNPFEFTVGVRQWGLLFIACYLLSTIAVYVGNFELGLFSLALIPLIALSFYSKPENFYFVWNYNRGSVEFLKDKIKIAMKYNLWIMLPMMVILSVLDPSKILWILGVAVIGSLMLIAMILGKYAAFPQEVSVAQGMIMGLCFIVFPLLIVLIPFLWKKANYQLSIQL